MLLNCFLPDLFSLRFVCYSFLLKVCSIFFKGSFNNGTNGTSCKTYLLESVSFSIIDEINRHMTIDLWNKAQCDSTLLFYNYFKYIVFIWLNEYIVMDKVRVYRFIISTFYLDCYQKSSEDVGKANYTQFSPCYQKFYELVNNLTNCMSKSNVSSVFE